jgi:putative endonuclease
MVGNAGEEFAAKILEDEGYMILERNYRTRIGEIDIIAAKDAVVHFIEVKTRTSDEYGYPADAVTEEKQNTIRRSAEIYMARRRLMWRAYSIDVAEVTFNLIEDCV